MWVCWRVTPPSPKGETILSPHALYRPFWTVAPSSSTEAGPEVKVLGLDFSSTAITPTQKGTSCNYEFWETVWLLPSISCMSSQDLLHFAGNVLFMVQTPGPIWGCPGCRWPLFLKKLQKMLFCSLGNLWKSSERMPHSCATSRVTQDHISLSCSHYSFQKSWECCVLLKLVVVGYHITQNVVAHVTFDAPSLV